MIILEQVSKIQSMLIFVDYLYFSLYTKITNKAIQILKKERVMKDLTKGRVFRNLFFYSIPIILSYLLARTHTTIDKVMVGQLIGENGLAAMKASLMTYFELGGFGVHYNVLDTETLIDAKKNPDKYPNLQVRLCGWNVLFNTLSEKDKDEFIARSMK